jgi:hypothetical protein
MQNTKHDARIDGDKLVKPDGKLFAIPPIGKLQGKTLIFSQQGEGLKMEDFRRPHGVRWKNDFQGYGYVSISRNQTRVELHKVETAGGFDVVGIVTIREAEFRAPFPLEDMHDALEWRDKRGLHGGLRPSQFRAAMGWKGAGAKEAATLVQTKVLALCNGRTVPDCPTVVFPPKTQPPSLVSKVESLEDRILMLEAAEVADPRASLEARLAKLEVRLASLEAITSFEP